MQDGRIRDSKITASSYRREGLAPWKARLLTNELGWAPLDVNVGEYLQIDLDRKSRIGAVATQGRLPGDSHNEYVKSYTLQSSDDGVQFSKYTINGTIKVGSVRTVNLLGQQIC